MCAHGLDDGVRFGIIQQRRLTIRPEDDEPGQPGLYPSSDIPGKTRVIDRAVFEWGGDWGENAFEIHAKNSNTLALPPLFV
jgi:hypothetical protein